MTRLALVLLAACAPAMRLGVEGHERAAEADERAAADEQRRYDPAQTAIMNECPFAGAQHESPCWTVDQNPTAVHLAEAQRRMRSAWTHREESQALRDAEARACEGLSAHDRDTSPFAHREDILSAAVLREDVGDRVREAGAVFVFRRVPNLTEDRLQKLVDCHLARNAAIGFADAEPGDPLDVPDVKVAVREGLRVEVVAPVQSAAREVEGCVSR